MPLRLTVAVTVCGLGLAFAEANAAPLVVQTEEGARHTFRASAPVGEMQEANYFVLTRPVQAAVQQYLAAPPLKASAMFDHLYATLPAAFQAQRAELEAYGEGVGADHAG